MATIHFAGVGAEYVTELGPDGVAMKRTYRVVEHPTKTFCGVGVTAQAQVMVGHDDKRVCKSCLKLIHTRTTAHVQPLLFQAGE